VIRGAGVGEGDGVGVGEGEGVWARVAIEIGETCDATSPAAPIAGKSLTKDRLPTLALFFDLFDFGLLFFMWSRLLKYCYLSGTMIPDPSP
jgi:hypothetical protein